MPTDLKKPLTPKQQSFVDAYLLCGNAKEAVELSDYETKNPDVVASQLMTNEAIRVALRGVQKQLVIQTDVSKLDIINNLWTMAMDAEQPGAVRVQANGLMAKILGYIVDKRELSGSVAVEHHAAMEGLTLDEIRALARDAIDRQTVALPEGAVTRVEGEHD